MVVNKSFSHFLFPKTIDSQGSKVVVVVLCNI